MVIVPYDTGTNPAIIFSAVDFPHPMAPKG